MIYGDGGHAAVIREFFDDSRGNIVAIGNNRDRKRVVEMLEQEGWSFLTAAIHPSAIIAKQVPVGVGAVIMAGAIVQPRAVIGRHVILNTGATVDHDCVIE